jgi:hypothetical protein
MTVKLSYLINELEFNFQSPSALLSQKKEVVKCCGIVTYSYQQIDALMVIHYLPHLIE